MKKITKENFFDSTTATFTHVNFRPDREPDFISYKNSYNDYKKLLINSCMSEIEMSFYEFKNLKNEYKGVSSIYWYTDKGVYRQSNHWGVVASCCWDIMIVNNNNNSDVVLGFCYWEDFNKESYILTPILYDVLDINFESFEMYFNKRDGDLLINHSKNGEFTEYGIIYMVNRSAIMYEKKFNIKVNDYHINSIASKYNDFLNER